MRTCEDGCNGCDDCTDYADEDDGPPEFGCCLPPGECCMPGLHFPSECHTAADYERAHPLDWNCGPREPPNRPAKRRPLVDVRLSARLGHVERRGNR